MPSHYNIGLHDSSIRTDMFWGKQSGRCAGKSWSHGGARPTERPSPSHARSRRVCVSRSHGLPTPTQVVDRKKSVHGGRAADAPGVAAAGGTPQACGIVWGPPEGRAVKVCTVCPREPSPAPVGEISAAGEGVRAVEGAQPALAGPEGLPAGSRGQGLALCKETTDLLLTGELGENGSVSQHTPRGRRAVRAGRGRPTQTRGDAGVCWTRGGQRGAPATPSRARGRMGQAPRAPQLRQRHSHVQGLLCLHHLLLGAVADQGVPVGQVQVECDQGAMLHAQGPQGRAIDLR